MLKFFKRAFLILFAIFFALASLVVLLEFCEQYKTGKLQDEIIPRIKYTITDANLLFPTNDYQKERRYMLWNQKVYLQLLDNLKSVKDGYVVSESDFDNEDATNPFADWNDIFYSKNTENILDLLIYGDLTETHLLHLNIYFFQNKQHSLLDIG